MAEIRIGLEYFASYARSWRMRRGALGQVALDQVALCSVALYLKVIIIGDLRRLDWRPSSVEVTLTKMPSARLPSLALFN